VLKFKCLAKRISYAKVDCCHLNPDLKRLNIHICAHLIKFSFGVWFL